MRADTVYGFKGLASVLTSGNRQQTLTYGLMTCAKRGNQRHSVINTSCGRKDKGTAVSNRTLHITTSQATPAGSRPHVTRPRALPLTIRLSVSQHACMLTGCNDRARRNSPSLLNVWRPLQTHPAARSKRYQPTNLTYKRQIPFIRMVFK